MPSWSVGRAPALSMPPPWLRLGCPSLPGALGWRGRRLRRGGALARPLPGRRRGEALREAGDQVDDLGLVRLLHVVGVRELLALELGAQECLELLLVLVVVLGRI